MHCEQVEALLSLFLLDELDNYSNAELEEISAGLEKDNSADQAEAEEALAQYAADLESCL